MHTIFIRILHNLLFRITHNIVHMAHNVWRITHTNRPQHVRYKFKNDVYTGGLFFLVIISMINTIIMCDRFFFLLYSCPVGVSILNCITKWIPIYTYKYGSNNLDARTLVIFVQNTLRRTFYNKIIKNHCFVNFFKLI